MSAIAHFLESEGIATSLIALIRPHAEEAKPPRALWVPFQLGRPMGAPLDATFQRRVLRTALELLNEPHGPALLVDFEDDEPGDERVADWAAPLGTPAGSVEQEIDMLEPYYDRSLQRTGRTTVGVSGLTVREAARYLLAVDTERPMENPRRDLAPVQVLRYAADDIKAYYAEALIEADRMPSAWQMNNWFWCDTVAGELLRALRDRSFEHPDPQRRYAAWWLVPDGWSSREEMRATRAVDYVP